MSDLTAAGDGLHVRREGSGGEPLFLVHGGWEDLRAWSGMTPLLATGFEVVAYDRRGHGTSPPDHGRGLDRDVQDLVRLLESTDLYPAHLAAQDSSCTVALRVAAERPELVRSVVLHEPLFVRPETSPDPGSGSTPLRSGVLERCREWATAGELDRSVTEYLHAFAAPSEGWAAFDPPAKTRWLANGPRWAEETVPEQTRLLLPEALAELAAPVFVTVGAWSPAANLRASQSLLELLPHGQVESVPDAGHLPHLFAPLTLASAWGRLLLERNVPPS